MLRLLCTTDLHGDVRAYSRLPQICREHGLTLIVNGGDLLPTSSPMHRTQIEFLSEHMPRYLDACDSAGIRTFAIFGNDDLKAFHPDWLALVAGRPGVFDLELRWHELEGGYWIRGNSFVPDYPFGLKDWCLRDLPESTPVPTRRPVITTSEGVEEIADSAAFFASRPTMAEHLATLVDPALLMERCILVSHAPPFGLGLGVLHSGEDVGSRAVRKFIEQHQPLLTLSGHIHESPDVGRAWSGKPCHTARCGRTTCHQPGQVLPRRLTTSIIEIDDATGTPIVRVAWKQEELPA
jgi:Icc-related predicted phosphoesterase